MVHIVKKVSHCPKELLEAYAGQATATVHEAMGLRGAVDPSIKPIARGMKICGSALTVQCHSGDNLMLVKAISMIRPGNVIVADMGMIVHSGPFGEVLATECQARGAAGLMVNCSVRDSQELIEMAFPVFSNGLCVFGTAKATLGTINHPISFGGVIVNPGDLILGDDDGVVVIPQSEAWEVLSAAEKRTAKENAVKERLKSGESLFDLYGYQKIFDELNYVEED